MDNTTAEVANEAPQRRTAVEWRACVAAFTFLTRLPAYRLAAHDQSDLPASAAYFPLVGLAVAAIGGAVFLASASIWPITIAVVLSVAATVWITGAFHEDAAADAFDGFGGGWQRDQVLAIMKDSRVGSYALVGVVLMIAGKLAALSAIAGGGPLTWLSGSGVFRALIAAHVLGRWSSVPLIWRYPYARPSDDAARPSAGKPFVDGLSGMRVMAATVLAFTIVFAALRWDSVLVIGVATVVTAVGGRYSQRRIGGITGDVLGAVNQFVELSTYLVLAAHPIPY